MPDNPAVRAVATQPYLAIVSRATEGAYCLWGDAADPPCATADDRMHPECALAALASSQEVREWLSTELAAREWMYDDLKRSEWATFSDVLTDAILHALGGGE